MNLTTRFFALNASFRPSTRSGRNLYRDIDGTLVLRLFGLELLLSPRRKPLALADRAPRPAIAVGGARPCWKEYRVRGPHLVGVLRARA
jgi:hypothetical protein